MSLLGRDTSFARRALMGLRRVLFPAPRPRVRPRRALVVAHRGTDDRVPENTIKGCRLVMDQGADGVEVDLCVTADRRVVLWHDCDPDELVAVARQGGAEGRTFVPRVPDFGSDLRRPVSELTLEELLESHGYDPMTDVPQNLLGFDPDVDCRLATFEELAAWAASEPRARVLVLDVKLVDETRAALPAILDAVGDAIRRHPELRERRIYLLTVQREVYELMARLVDGREDLAPVATVPDFELPGVMEGVVRLGARHVSIGINPRRTWAATRHDIAEAIRAREAGNLDSVLAWTANDEDVLEELGRLAVDVVMTDDVPLARRVLDREHERHVRLLRRRERARIKMPGEKVR